MFENLSAKSMLPLMQLEATVVVQCLMDKVESIANKPSIAAFLSDLIAPLSAIKKNNLRVKLLYLMMRHLSAIYKVRRY